MTIDKLIETFTKTVLTQFRDVGEIPAPVWMIETGEGELLIVLTPVDDDTDKDMVAEAIRKLIKTSNADRYAMAMESWFASGTAESFNNSLMPSQRSDRKEGVFISAEDRNGETRAFVHEIERKAGKVQLKPPSSLGGNFGRFANMFGGTQQ